MADEPKPEESERAKKFHRIATGTVPPPDQWDAKMAASAWTDPALPLLDRANERRKQLLAERDIARDRFKALQAELIELKIKIDQLTGGIHIIDELVDQMLEKDIPRENNHSEK
jgi:hypothetical protein